MSFKLCNCPITQIEDRRRQRQFHFSSTALSSLKTAATAHRQLCFVALIFIFSSFFAPSPFFDYYRHASAQPTTAERRSNMREQAPETVLLLLVVVHDQLTETAGRRCSCCCCCEASQRRQFVLLMMASSSVIIIMVMHSTVRLLPGKSRQTHTLTLNHKHWCRSNF